jgi:uncharacterized protein (TIGR02646 family)
LIGDGFVIKIEKPVVPPEKLTIDGKRKSEGDGVSFASDPAAYQSGEKKFEFDRTIYAHHTVKAALNQAQNKKCCFCESLVGLDGDVEHFRPKQAVRQATGQPLQYPGYYWLAYEWSNLYLACSACNQRHKQNLFPIEEGSERATDAQKDLGRERSLFIDPGQDDPETLIRFRGEVPFSIDDNIRGRATIDALRLDKRDGLREARLQRLQMARCLFAIIKEAEQMPENLELQKFAQQGKEWLDRYSHADQEYAAAMRCAIATDFRYVIG